MGRELSVTEVAPSVLVLVLVLVLVRVRVRVCPVVRLPTERAEMAPPAEAVVSPPAGTEAPAAAGAASGGPADVWAGLTVSSADVLTPARPAPGSP
ncbi:hypothetical protein GCM10009654_02100 [Streptomyces hebeiensis]|uniref:Secreted protein n=1 Tax=Streptomyces hebeiensis TaxID=229486 RepID=A0ABN1UGA8_9ACTN